MLIIRPQIMPGWNWYFGSWCRPSPTFRPHVLLGVGGARLIAAPPAAAAARRRRAGPPRDDPHGSALELLLLLELQLLLLMMVMILVLVVGCGGRTHSGGR